MNTIIYFRRLTLFAAVVAFAKLYKNGETLLQKHAFLLAFAGIFVHLRRHKKAVFYFATNDAEKYRCLNLVIKV